MDKLRTWILRPIDQRAAPWNPWYDKCFGMVVIAFDEGHARRLAVDACEDEGRDAWADSKLSTCVELKPTVSAVVLKDVHSA